MLGLVGDKAYHLVLTMNIPHVTLPAASRLAEWLSMLLQLTGMTLSFQHLVGLWSQHKPVCICLTVGFAKQGVLRGCIQGWHENQASVIHSAKHSQSS